MKETYLIPERNLNELNVRIEKLNKRAAKLHVSPIIITTSEAYHDHEFTDPSRPRAKPKWIPDHELTSDETHIRIVGAAKKLPDDPKHYHYTGRVRKWLNVTVEGETPKFAGWSLIGVLEPLALDDGTAENIVRAVPGHSVPAKYRGLIGECDHCHTKRRRTETFVVKHDNGATKMVGRNCLKDFLGHADPHALAKFAEILFELSGLCSSASEDGWLGGSFEPNVWTLEHFLTITSAIIREEGWLSKTKAMETDRRPTAYYVSYYLTPPSAAYMGVEARKAWREYTDKIDEILKDQSHKKLADDAIEWAKSIEPAESEDYLHNVNLIARAGYVKEKSVGLACSIIAAYKRALGIGGEGKPKTVSEYVGKVGERLSMELECNKVIPIEGFYGSTGLHKLSDVAGNELVWFSSGSNWLEEGVTYRASATVKEHREYHGVKQTVLTRLAVPKSKSKVEV